MIRKYIKPVLYVGKQHQREKHENKIYYEKSIIGSQTSNEKKKKEAKEKKGIKFVEYGG